MKDFLDTVFSKTSIKPATTDNIGTHKIYIADGFVTYDQLPVIQSKFPGVLKAGKEGRDEFPSGCWATLWLIDGKFAARGGMRVSGDKDYSVRIDRIKEAAREELTRKIN